MTKSRPTYPNRPWIPKERYATLVTGASRAELLEELAVYVKLRPGKSGRKSARLSLNPRRPYRPLLSPEEYRILSTTGTREHLLTRLQSFVPKTGGGVREVRKVPRRVLLKPTEFQRLVREGRRPEIIEALRTYVVYPVDLATVVGKLNRILLRPSEFDQLVSRSRRTELLRRLEYYVRRTRGPRYEDQEETPAAVRMRRSRERRRDPSIPKLEYHPKIRARESLPWVRPKQQRKKKKKG